jgi:hypothetical protein
VRAREGMDMETETETGDGERGGAGTGTGIGTGTGRGGLSKGAQGVAAPCDRGGRRHGEGCAGRSGDAQNLVVIDQAEDRLRKRFRPVLRPHVPPHRREQPRLRLAAGDPRGGEGLAQPQDEPAELRCEPRRVSAVRAAAAGGGVAPVIPSVAEPPYQPIGTAGSRRHGRRWDAEVGGLVGRELCVSYDIGGSRRRAERGCGRSAGS